MSYHDEPPGRIVTGGSAPRPEERKIHVLRIKPGQPYRILMTNWTTLSLKVHWDGKREMPHVEPAESCYFCAQGWKPRWTAFAAGWIEEVSRYYIVPITVHCVQTCPALDPKSGQDLRGRYLTVRRIGSDIRSPIEGRLSTERVSLHVCPAELDLAAAVAVHYGLRKDALRVGGDEEPEGGAR